MIMTLMIIYVLQESAESAASGLEPFAAAPSPSEGKGVEEGGWEDNNEKVM